MADASTGRDAGEPRVSQYGHLLAERQVTKRCRDLVDLLHTGPGRPSADQHQHVSWTDRLLALALDCPDCFMLAREHARWPGFAISSIRIHDAGVDRRALDHRPLRLQVSARKSDR